MVKLSTIAVTPELLKRLKLQAIAENTNVKALAERILEDYLNSVSDATP